MENSKEPSEKLEQTKSTGLTNSETSKPVVTYELFQKGEAGLVGYSGDFTPEQIQKVKAYIHRRSVGSAELMCRRCPGDALDDDGSYTCGSYERCPIQQSGLELPVKEACPIEMATINDMFVKLAEFLELDQDNPVDTMGIMDIVKLQLLEARALDEMQTTKIIQEIISAVDPKTGITFKSKMDNPAIRIIQSLQKSRGGTMKQLVATREDKSKAGGRDDAVAGKLGTIMERIAEHKRLKLIESSTIVDVEVIEVDKKEE
jgi:hypothetical protein